MEKIPLAFWETLGAAFGKDWHQLEFKEIQEGYRLYCEMQKEQGLQTPNVFQFFLAFEEAKKRKTEQKRAPLFSSLYYDLDEVPRDLFTYFLRRRCEDILKLDPIEQEAIFNKVKEKFKIPKAKIKEAIKSLTGPKKPKETTNIVEQLVPYDGEVNGAELANEVEQILRRFVFLEKEEYYTTVTLWVFLTYCFERFSILPMLLITSPLMRCGKTTLLSVLRGLVNKSLIASNISPAAIYRTVDKYKPSLLIDEADTGLAQNEELRGIVNAGHTKDTAFVIRAGSRETNFEPERFSTFCPKAIAMIGKPAPTWIDRSFEIKMQRKPRDLCLEKLPHDFYETVRPLRQKLLRWACRDLKQVDLETPELLNDRAADNWQPLLSIAHSLSHEWVKKVEEAMISIGGEEDDDLKVELLKDIQRYFKEQGDRVPSKELVEYLNNLEDRPWGDLKGGKGLTTNMLAKILSSFGIRPKTIRVPYQENKTSKGYKEEDFEKSFKRYLPSQNVTPSQSRNNGHFEQKQNVTKSPNVTFSNSRKPPSDLQCYGVTDQKGGIEQKYIVTDSFIYNGQVYREGEEVYLPLSIAEELLKAKHIRGKGDGIII